MEKVKAHLELNKPIRTLEVNEDEEAFKAEMAVVREKRQKVFQEQEAEKQFLKKL